MTDKCFHKPLNILLWRTWKPLYDYSATFSSLNEKSIGGTCSQLLWHARNLVGMGHSVQVLGVTKEDVKEEKVDFIGSLKRQDQEKLLRSGRIIPPDVIFLEGAFEAADLFRSSFPNVHIIHIGQNIDQYAYRKALNKEIVIDAYAFVSPGHFADYCVRYPKLRHKFFLIRNIVPWNHLYCKVTAKPVEDKILWIGAWTKKGLRQWAETMQQILKEYPSYQWVLCGPNHGSHVGGMPSYIMNGLEMPEDRISVKSLPLSSLAEEISSARIVLVSLGNETACISALDAHAMGRPVISGNDMVFKYNNTEGTGIRVFTAAERYNAIVKLMNDHQLCDRLGAAGKEMILSDFTEINQQNDLSKVLNYVAISNSLGEIADYIPPASWINTLSNVIDKVKRKIL